MKIKKNFLNILTKKVKEIYKVLNKLKINKLKFNMITKGLSRKQLIVLISLTNLEKFMALLSKYIFNINRLLQDIKSDIMADFI